MFGLKLLAVIIVMFIIIIMLQTYWQVAQDSFDTGVRGVGTTEKPYIYLYEGFGQKDLAYRLDAYMGDYVKEIFPISLKSVDIYLPKMNNKYDEIRRIEIWSVNGGDNMASIETNFYNAYLEPELELRANSAKYQQIAMVLPGQHLRTDITAPVKKIFLMATM